MQVQRFTLSQGAPSYTAVDENGLPVAHIEAFLRYERQVASPNTVRAYARAIVRWHNFLRANTLSREKKPITIASISQEAGVSRNYLYKHPELRAQIEKLKPSVCITRPLQAAPDPGQENIVAALRLKIRKHGRAAPKRS